MTEYALRIRFNSNGSAVAHDGKALEFPIADSGRTVVLKAVNADTLNKAARFSIQIRGFEDHASANSFGQRIKHALLVCGVKLRTGLDPGEDVGSGAMVTDAGKQWLRQTFGIGANVPIHNDVHGLLVYEDCEPEPRFRSIGADASLVRNKEHFIEAFLEGFGLAAKLTESQLLALEMYNLSHFETSPRARFVTLVTAVECIAKPQEQSPEIMELIDRLAQQAEADAVVTSLSKENPASRDSLLGRLTALKRESIGKACERVLGERLGEPSRAQFKQWYDVRSKIVHTGIVPQGVNLASEVMRLDEMVSHLLLAAIQAG